jgi:hypothetical protein
LFLHLKNLRSFKKKRAKKIWSGTAHLARVMEHKYVQMEGGHSAPGMSYANQDPAYPATEMCVRVSTGFAIHAGLDMAHASKNAVWDKMRKKRRFYNVN